MKKTLLILTPLLIIFAVALYYYFISSKNTTVPSSTTPPPTAEVTTETITTSPSMPITDNKLKYNSKGISFSYPKDLEKLISSKQFGVEKNSKTEMIKSYEKYQKEGGCPANCGRLAEDPKLRDLQFSLLEKVANSPTCTLSKGEVDEINKNLILFSGGITSRKLTTTLKTESGACLLKIVESSGFDASLQNFGYKIIYIKSDNVYNMYISLFPFNGTEETKAYLKKLGYDLENLSCDAKCMDAQTRAFENFSISDPTVVNTIATYDEIAKTLTF